ncbi:MAG: ribose-5-phosphate isomerase RpiA [Candidatus Latescibacteria bacterium]|jgi:ribose 5-phosphate isomerase A|nr:ribose-5-phosphate isomerase RpiA [Candidatus Latescibacterota bacterium]MBT4138526.1 ribose-5-phosphate isomerase RpiA [Candidatus Latescibacterota bacterium]
MTHIPKQLAGERAAQYVEDDMIVGLGTGSTAFFTIQKLGQRIAQGLKIKGIPTSEQSRQQALAENIPLIDFDQTTHLDLTIDGADEIDPQFNLTKGGGGALLREKIVAQNSAIEIIVVDPSKWVKHLGAYPLPVEVVPFGWQATLKHIAQLGCKPKLRLLSNAPILTDNGNYILDCDFKTITDPPTTEKTINAICGVVECGLFTNLAHRVIIGHSDGTVEEKVL